MPGSRSWDSTEPPRFELELVPGLEEVVADELRERHGHGYRAVPTDRPGRLALADPIEPGRLNESQAESRMLSRSGACGFRRGSGLESLRTVVAVHLVTPFGVTRPRALLGHQALNRVLAAVHGVLAGRPDGFRTMRLSAAGADSPELSRLRDEIAGAFRLEPVRERAQLLVSLRPAAGGAAWELLVRTTPRPLSARAWRVCDLPGALDATVAAAMARLAGPSPDERYLNLGCGSATLLVERLALGPAAAAVGVDRDAAALDCAGRNLAAAGFLASTGLVRGDLTALALPDRAFDTAVADLPFGQLSGSAAGNRRLYPALLAETARVVGPGGGFVAITAHTAGFWAALERAGSAWRLERRIGLRIPFARGYVRPSIWLLRR
jgi:23S rRNA G2445 N2-methylase RlmL